MILEEISMKDFDKKVKMVLDDIKAATHAKTIGFGKGGDISADKLKIKMSIKLA